MDNSLEVFSWAVPNLVEISDFAQEKFGWSRHKVDELIKPIIKKLDARVSQTRIDNYFQSESVRLPEKGGGSGRIQNSKRVRSAIDNLLGRVRPGEETSTTSEKKELQPKARTVAGSTKSKKEEEEERKRAAKEKAIEIYKKGGGRKRQRKSKVKPPKRLVLEKHNLSESDSD